MRCLAWGNRVLAWEMDRFQRSSKIFAVKTISKDLGRGSISLATKIDCEGFEGFGLERLRACSRLGVRKIRTTGKVSHETCYSYSSGFSRNLLPIYLATDLSGFSQNLLLRFAKMLWSVEKIGSNLG